MSEISKKVAYIKGMAEGMELTADTAKDAKDKLLLQMLDALDLIAEWRSLLICNGSGS